MEQKKLNILQVLPALEVGGIERGAVEMANYLCQNGHNAFIASNGGRMENDLQNDITHINIPLHKRTPWHLYKCSKAIARLIKDYNIDIVHARSRIPAWAARIACSKTNTPMVATFHGAHKNQNAIKRWYNSGAAKADRVIAISQFIKNYLIENFSTPEAKIDIAPRGVDTSIFTPTRFTSNMLEDIRTQYNIPENTPILNLTGRITRWKGHSKLVDVLSHIKDLPWVCLFIGDVGVKKDYFNALNKQIKEAGLEDRILFIHNQKDPAPFYLLSDLAFSMSLEPEAFGRVAIEAQAMGTAIFATAHGGSLETVINNKTGFLVDHKDTEGMVKILRNAIKDVENLHQMGHNGRAHILEHFTVEHMCNCEFQSYTKLLNEFK